jgi:hypothetical protein
MYGSNRFDRRDRGYHPPFGSVISVPIARLGSTKIRPDAEPLPNLNSDKIDASAPYKSPAISYFRRALMRHQQIKTPRHDLLANGRPITIAVYQHRH